MIMQDMPDLLRPAPKPQAHGRGQPRGPDEDAPGAEAPAVGAEPGRARPARGENSAAAPDGGFERVLQTQAMATPAAAISPGAPGISPGAPDISPPGRAFSAAELPAGPANLAPGLPQSDPAARATPAAAPPIAEAPPPEAKAATLLPVETAAAAIRRGEGAIQPLAQEIAAPAAAPVGQNPDARIAPSKAEAAAGHPARNALEQASTPLTAPPKADERTPPDAPQARADASAAAPAFRPPADRGAQNPVAAAPEPGRPAEIGRPDAAPDQPPRAEALAAPFARAPLAQKGVAPASTATPAGVDAVAEFSTPGFAAEDIATTERPRPAPAHAAPARPIAMATSVSTQIAAAVVPGEDGAVEIRLDPPELGRVKLTLSSSEAGVAATILSDRPETNDLLRRHADILQRELRNAGHADVMLSFGSNGSEARRGAAYDRAAPPEHAPATVRDAAAPISASAARRAGAGLDIRL